MAKRRNEAILKTLKTRDMPDEGIHQFETRRRFRPGPAWQLTLMVIEVPRRLCVGLTLWSMPLSNE